MLMLDHQNALKALRMRPAQAAVRGRISLRYSGLTHCPQGASGNMNEHHVQSQE